MVTLILPDNCRSRSCQFLCQSSRSPEGEVRQHQLRISIFFSLTWTHDINGLMDWIHIYIYMYIIGTVGWSWWYTLLGWKFFPVPRFETKQCIISLCGSALWFWGPWNVWPAWWTWSTTQVETSVSRWKGVGKLKRENVCPGGLLWLWLLSSEIINRTSTHKYGLHAAVV